MIEENSTGIGAEEPPHMLHAGKGFNAIKAAAEMICALIDVRPNDRVNIPHKDLAGFLIVHANGEGCDGILDPAETLSVTVGRERGLSARGTRMSWGVNVRSAVAGRRASATIYPGRGDCRTVSVLQATGG
jgi:hypothetical protein